MDELEFRRRIMSDPKNRDSEVSAAINSSDKNSQFVDEVMELDKKIAKAMSVDAPDDLADRILFTHTSTHEDNLVRPNFARRAMAMAASVAFVVGLLVGQVNWGNLIVKPAQASLEETAMDHVLNEKAFVSSIDEQVPSAQINAKMLPFAYQLSKTFPYHVYYLNHCGFGHTNAVHMVFQGDKGKVTLFLTRISSEDTRDFNEKGMAGFIEPMGETSLILVGDENENLANIAENLSKIIKPII